MSDHLCHANGCKEAVPPSMLMCRKHWFMVPGDVQQQVWAEYVPGQEDRKDPTDAYLAVAQDAIAAVEDHETAYRLSGDGLVCWSLEWEAKTGADSIPTVERVYDTTGTGAYLCVYPRCGFSRKDAVAMWRHVHFSRKHH